MNTKKIAWCDLSDMKSYTFLMEYNTLCFVNITMMIIWYADYNWNFCACSCLALPCLCKVSMLTYLWIREKKCQQSKKPTRSNDHPLSTALLHHNLKSILIFFTRRKFQWKKCLCVLNFLCNSTGMYDKKEKMVVQFLVLNSISKKIFQVSHGLHCWIRIGWENIILHAIFNSIHMNISSWRFFWHLNTQLLHNNAIFFWGIKNIIYFMYKYPFSEKDMHLEIHK